MENEDQIVNEIDYKAQALVKHLNDPCIDDDFDVEVLMENCIYECQDKEYLVLTGDEPFENVKGDIHDSIYAFNRSFLAEQTGLPFGDFLKEEYSDELNEFLIAIVEMTCGMDKFVEEAIRADGRGHFLASYDGAESIVEVNGNEYYIYRVN